MNTQESIEAARKLIAELAAKTDRTAAEQDEIEGERNYLCALIVNRLFEIGTGDVNKDLLDPKIKALADELMTLPPPYGNFEARPAKNRAYGKPDTYVLALILELSGYALDAQGKPRKKTA